MGRTRSSRTAGEAKVEAATSGTPVDSDPRTPHTDPFELTSEPSQDGTARQPRRRRQRVAREALGVDASGSHPPAASCAEEAAPAWQPTDGRLPATRIRSWEELGDDVQQRAVAVTVRLLLLHEHSRVPLPKRELMRILAERLGVQAGPSGRLPSAMVAVRNKAVELASRKLLLDFGYRVEEACRLPLGVRSGASGHVAETAHTAALAVYNNAAAARAENAERASGDAYILLTDLPEALRAPPSDAALAGLCLVLACVLALEPTGYLTEHKLFRVLTELGVRGLSTDATTSSLHADDAPDSIHLAMHEDMRHWLQVRLPRMMYLQRFRLQAPSAEYFYAAGPRLRAELPPESLFRLLRELFGDGMDDSCRRELKARLLPERLDAHRAGRRRHATRPAAASPSP
eukprot:ctg_393.g199